LEGVVCIAINSEYVGDLYLNNTTRFFVTGSSGVVVVIFSAIRTVDFIGGILCGI
jgi:arginine utilization protein RocB